MADAFGAVDMDPTFAEIGPRWNVAPSQTIPVLVREPAGRVLRSARWGVAWQDLQGTFHTLINVRSESLSRPGPLVRRLMGRRCAIPADGFYEWAKRGERRQPWLFRRRDGQPFLMAGLCTLEGDQRSAAILTTRPCELVAAIHDRMPVILPKEAWDPWLDPAFPIADRTWFKPFPSEELVGYPVGRWVNDPRHDGPECAQPLQDPTFL